MIFSDSFAQLLNVLSREVWNKVTHENKNNPSFRDVLDCAVNSWCCKLDIPNEGTRYINQWQQDEIKEITNDIWNEWKPKTNYSLWGVQTSISKFKEYILTKVVNRMKNPDDNIKFILLIAFVVTGVGYALYLLHKKSERQAPSSKSSQSVSTLPPRQDKAYHTWTLVLVINAGQEEIIQSLKTNCRVMPNEGEALYRATQALWMDSEADFSKSELKNRFYDAREERESKKSEYDVHFLQIELYKRDPGFYPNANQIDRLDAFRRLPENSGKVIVSPRLPSKAYENTDVYSR